MEINTANELYRMCCIVVDRNLAPLGPDRIFMPRIMCEDGFSFSCQAGSGFYSLPRKDGEYEYTAFEIGYPSTHEPLLDKYYEMPDRDPEDWTNAVYVFVPVQVVQLMLEKHGGIEALGLDEIPF